MKFLSSLAKTVPFIQPVQTLILSAAHLTEYQREHTFEAPGSVADSYGCWLTASIDRDELLDPDRFAVLIESLNAEFFPEWASYVELLQALALRLPHIDEVRFDVDADRLADIPVFEDVD